MDNKILLYSTGIYIQYPIIMEKIWKRIYIHTYNQITVVYQKLTHCKLIILKFFFYICGLNYTHKSSLNPFVRKIIVA